MPYRLPLRVDGIYEEPRSATAFAFAKSTALLRICNPTPAPLISPDNFGVRKLAARESVQSVAEELGKLVQPQPDDSFDFPPCTFAARPRFALTFSARHAASAVTA